MRRVTWLMLVGAVCVGCGQKAERPAPDDPNDPQVVVPLRMTPPAAFELSYGQLWDPKGAEKVDPVLSIKDMLAQRYFAKHQTEVLAPATVGSFVSLAQGGPHGVVMPVALASAYPNVAEKLETGTGWKDGLATLVPSTGTVMDFSSSTGATKSRLLVLSVKGGTDDELRTRFDEYVARVEKAVKATGATTTPRRGEARPTGALSDIRFETAEHTGSVRSVVIREYDDSDKEFASTILSDAKEEGDLFRGVMGVKSGTYLVVSLRGQRR